MGQCLIKLADHVRRCPFLRAEYRRCALFARKRVGDIASHFYAAFRKTRVQPPGVDALKLTQRFAATRDLLALCIQQACAQRLHHACPTVVGGAAAKADYDMPHACIQRVTD